MPTKYEFQTPEERDAEQQREKEQRERRAAEEYEILRQERAREQAVFDKLMPLVDDIVRDYAAAKQFEYKGILPNPFNDPDRYDRTIRTGRYERSILSWPETYSCFKHEYDLVGVSINGGSVCIIAVYDKVYHKSELWNRT